MRLGKANTAVLAHGGITLALEEGDAPYQIELPNLDTVKRFTYDNQLKHNFTAHPKATI